MEARERDGVGEVERESERERVKLTPAQKAMIEQKRQEALIRRRERANKRNPYNMAEREKVEKKVIRINNTKMVDSGGGFYIEEEEEGEGGVTKEDMLAAMQIVTDPAPFLEVEDRPVCGSCKSIFHTSFLLDHFNHSVCDQCRDRDEAHALITRTDARQEYLLKDVDLDKREPPLRYIVRANPHNSAWGDMKLYLKLQVEKRALEVWGSEEALEEELQKKEEQKQKNKLKKYNKKMKELRMNVRSSLYTRASKTHTHTYGEEVYLPDEDEYQRTCDSCGHSYTYDKM
ncbi:DNA repair protein complementing XP-A cells homolog [Portunus trituberculatus]|uniref:DNA repair protein complementing XP-A cells homolog n=1 Tax=Portunus trituberculatus TaxID=210409 RepID=UPI001E1D02EC|nr:DNA repair protein complementing XP-A cells homolog [Portunus trituberculatus]